MFKRQCVIFRSRGKRIPNNVDFLEVGEYSFAQSEHVKFLGVILDEGRKTMKLGQTL